MLKIYLVRHGQDEDNAEGLLNGRRNRPLTKLGVEQATTLAAKIKNAGLSFGAIYSSPLDRVYGTAEIISRALSMPSPEILPDLIERDFGIMTGKLVKDIEKICAPDIFKADPVVYFLSPEGAETFPALLERGKKVVAWVRDHHSDGNILLVTHGDIGKMIYAAYYHLDWQRVLALFHFGNSELILLSEDSSAETAHVFKAEQYNH
jgi:broad specificity phosphatase PhoE